VSRRREPRPAAHLDRPTGDVAALLVAAAADPTAHGRAWHVPVAPPRTQREALADLAALAGVPVPTVKGTSPVLLRLVGTVAPAVREVAGVSYQFAEPFVLDDSAAREHFGLEPSPWAETLRRALATDPPPARGRPPEDGRGAGTPDRGRRPTDRPRSWPG
jgi:nucleoside-diphosphate-sugar epimerase